MDMGMRNGWERMVCMSDESGASELQGKLDAEHTRCIKTRIERAIDCRKVLPHSISPPSPLHLPSSISLPPSPRLLPLIFPIPSTTHLSHPVHHSSFPSRPPLIFPIPSTTHLSHPVHHSLPPSTPQILDSESAQSPSFPEERDLGVCVSLTGACARCSSTIPPPFKKVSICEGLEIGAG